MPTTDTDALLLEELLHGDGPACEWVGHAWDDGPPCLTTVTHSMVQACNGVGFLTCANGARWARWVIGRSRLHGSTSCIDCARDVARCWRIAPV